MRRIADRVTPGRYVTEDYLLSLMEHGEGQGHGPLHIITYVTGRYGIRRHAAISLYFDSIGNSGLIKRGIR